MSVVYFMKMGEHQFLAILMIAAMFAGYMAVALLPWWIAKRNRKAEVTLVLIVGVLAGWTVAGWIVALGIAIFGRSEDPRKITIPVRVE